MTDLFFEEAANSTVLVPVEFGSDDFLQVSQKAKEITGQIDWVITHRKIEYLGKMLSLSKHKSIQVRRKVAAGFGIIGRQDTIFELQKWQLHEPDRQTWLILESSIDKIQRGAQGQDLVVDARVFSVTEAVGLIKKLIGQKEYVIEGEVSEVKPIHQMYYFGLKDSQESRLDCASFVGKIARAGFALNEGLSIRATGTFKLGKTSRLYFDILKIELTGEGELLRNLKLLQERLKAEGLFDASRKRRIKAIPKNILLIASPNSAAITDFMKVLDRRMVGINVYLLPIKTQGVGAEFEILEKLAMANTLTDKYEIDTVVLTRGGGSKDDLFVFNSEKVVRSVHALNRPSIVAIGHERDTCLSELVADLRAATPSQAAELASTSKIQILLQAREVSNFCHNFFNAKKQEYNMVTSQLLQRILYKINLEIQAARSICQQTYSASHKIIYRLRDRVNKDWISILFFCKNSLYQFKNILDQIANLQEMVGLEINQQKIAVKQSYARIFDLTQVLLQKNNQQFILLSRQIELENPENILKKGYAIVRQKDRIITKLNNFNPKLKLSLEFVDGKIDIAKSTSK